MSSTERKRNLVNIEDVIVELQKEGALFQTSTDTEIIIHLIAREKGKNLAEKVERALQKIEGAYSLILLSPTEIIAARDPHGIRPFCMGKLQDTVVFASETCALDLLGAKVIGYSLNPLTKPSIFEIVKLKKNITHVLGDINNFEKLQQTIKTI